jgi:serine/threonine protein kinase
MAARWWSESAKSFRRSSVVARWVWFTKLRTRLDRFVAVKFLPDDVAGNRQVLERFRREAKAATAIYHRNICVLHDVGEENVPPADAISVVRLLRRVTEDESERTILIALFADIVIAIAKLIGGRSQFDSGPRHNSSVWLAFPSPHHILGTGRLSTGAPRTRTPLINRERATKARMRLA